MFIQLPSGWLGAPGKALVRLFFAEPAPEGGWSNLHWFILMWLFGLTSMISVAIGDVQNNLPCVDACKADGWSNGRLRGDPHAPPGDGPFVYECWCYTGSEWSAVPIEPGRLQP